MLRIPALRSVFCLAVLSACSSPPAVREPRIDPDAARSEISQRLPPAAANRDGWAIDIFAAFEALSIRPTTQHICAVIAVTGQESTFEVDPQVAGLATIARREIDTAAAGCTVPRSPASSRRSGSPSESTSATTDAWRASRPNRERNDAERRAFPARIHHPRNTSRPFPLLIGFAVMMFLDAVFA